MLYNTFALIISSVVLEDASGRWCAQKKERRRRGGDVSSSSYQLIITLQTKNRYPAVIVRKKTIWVVPLYINIKSGTGTLNVRIGYIFLLSFARRNDETEKHGHQWHTAATTTEKEKHKRKQLVSPPIFLWDDMIHPLRRKGGAVKKKKEKGSSLGLVGMGLYRLMICS